MRRPAAAGVIALVALACISCGGEETAQSAKPKSTADVLRATERTRIHALVVNDMERARPLHGDDFLLTAPTGDEFTKTEYLEAVGSGRLDYVRWEPISRIRVSVDGDTATVRYRSEIGFAGNYGGTTEQTHSDTYKRRQGRWQIVRSVTVFDDPSSP